jgi:predicted phage terminase large subunit-like protein
MGAAEKREVITIAPQPGPQEMFLSSEADIAIYGGAAGGGKSFGLLLEPIRHWNNPDFGCVIFRRTSTQVRNEGGLWDASAKIYPNIMAHPKESALEWIFPHPATMMAHGARIKFAHLEYDKTVLDWQGSEIALIGFDELTHFSKFQFFYMLSRNRSTCGVNPYIRATTNPDPDSWVKEFISWWLGEDGFPIQERSGKIRWFVRLNDIIHWADSKQELYDQFGSGPEILPLSVTFISASVHDNKILLEKDPAYLAKLHALPRVDRMRLLGGNWNVRAAAGMLFKREWFPVVDAIPAGWISCIRFWDRAATKPSNENPDPDWTRGLKMYRYPDNTFVVADLRSARDTPLQIERLILNTAAYDSHACAVMSQQDPGSAGVMEKDHFIRMLAGFDVRTMTTSKDKLTRAKPVSAQCEAGNVKVLRAPWNEEFFSELENFPDGAHDDIVDVLSGAFNEVSGGLSLADAL